MPVAAKPPPKRTRSQIIADAEKKGWRYAYGSLFPPVYDVKGVPRGTMPDWMVEAHCLRAKLDFGSEKRGKNASNSFLQEGARPKNYMGYAEHFKCFVSCIWGKKNPVLHFEWNPNAERIVDELFVEGRKFLGIAGNKSSSKTETLAVVAVALFLISPRNTKCILTSKTLKAAKAKNWGRILLVWQAAVHFFGAGDLRLGEAIAPGVLKDGIIEYREGDFRTATAGIELVASEQSQLKKAADKIQGIKQVDGTIFVDAEELATLPHGLVETCRDNLTSNPGFKFAGPFNPIHYFDGAMLVAKPKDGWESITVEDQGWETELGYCIHFDGTKSPNVLEEGAPWKGLYTREQLRQDEEWHRGQNTPGFWQMVRGFWSPVGSADAIFSGQEIMSYHGDRHAKNGWWWMEEPKRLAGLDPAYVGGGDRAVAYFADVGRAEFEDRTQRLVCELKGYKILAADVTKGHDKSLQVAQAFKAECESRGVPVQNTGIDATGGGGFSPLLRMVWGDGFLEVTFSEEASESPVSDTDPMPAKDRYMNRASEIWFSMKVLMRSQQLKGIDPDVASELCNRTFQEINGRIRIEKKDDMKLRTGGQSCDIADGAAVVVDVARQNFGLASTEKSREREGGGNEDSEFFEWAKKMGGMKLPDLKLDASY